MNILELTAKEIPQLLKEKKLTAVQVTEAYLQRIEEMEPKINAYITVTRDEAMKAAKRVDEKISNGQDLGKLAGIPISIKDNISVNGVGMTCGSKMLKDYVAPYDATLVKRILAEDGIILGKVNMDEFAMGAATKNEFTGYTANPLDTTRVAGGSSGGSAASVGAGEALLSVGTDTGGSVRQPAAFCGLVGMKPSYGTISRFGISTMANTFDQPGVIGRTVEDVVHLLQVLEGDDLQDPSNTGNPQIRSLEIKEQDFSGYRLAIPSIVAKQKLSPAVEESFRRGVETLKAKGAVIEEVDMPSLAYVVETYHILVNGELAPNMSRFDGLRYGHRTEEYATPEEMYIRSRSEAFGAEVKRRIMIGTHILSLDLAKDYYDKALAVRTMIRQEFDRVFRDYDAVISPTYPVDAYPMDREMTPVEIYVADLFTLPANLAGLPGISIPIPNGTDLPGGFQFIGKRYDDHVPVQLAYSLERSLK